MQSRKTRHRRHAFEALESREMFAAGVIERPGYPLYVDASLSGNNLVIEGTELGNRVIWSYVRPEQVNFKKADGSWLIPRDGKIYIELRDSGPTVNGQAHPMRQAWIQADKVKNGWIYFDGKGGDDRFEHAKVNQKEYWVDYPVKIYARGGDGKDTLHGYHGNDILLGEDHNDFLRGGVGDDLLMGGAGNDTLFGDGVHRNEYSSNDCDYLIGGSQTDTLKGWQGRDILNGGNAWSVIDGAPDRLSGELGADYFFFELGMNEEKNSDFNKISNQKDKKYEFGGATPPSARPPDVQEWLMERHSSIDPKGELATIRKSYPKVAQMYGPYTSDYNCIAAALGIYHTKVWPSPREEYITLAELKTTFKNNGYGNGPPAAYKAANVKGNAAAVERVVLYGEKDASGNIKIFHAARQLENGKWLSKLGDQGLVVHNRPEDIAGKQYGKPLFVYERPRFTDPCECGKD